jgi:DNA replication and repair protein RecF
MANAIPLTRLSAALASAREAAPQFPHAEIALDGWMEKFLPHQSAAEIEDRYRALLRENRGRDAAAGRTLEGPHLTDLNVCYADKAVPAKDASTGEQKALLIRLVLAHARLIKDMTGFAPVLLLDEVIAHLDPKRRIALYDALTNLGAQVWMTGADLVAFGDIVDRATMFEVRSGTVTSLNESSAAKLGA